MKKIRKFRIKNNRLLKLNAKQKTLQIKKARQQKWRLNNV